MKKSTRASTFPEQSPNPFQVISPKNGSRRQSALFYHIMQTGNACIEAFMNSGAIIKVTLPNVNSNTTKNYFIWELDRKPLKHDLFACLPKATLDKKQYGRVKLSHSP